MARHRGTKMVLSNENEVLGGRQMGLTLTGLETAAPHPSRGTTEVFLDHQLSRPYLEHQDRTQTVPTRHAGSALGFFFESLQIAHLLPLQHPSRPSKCR